MGRGTGGVTESLKERAGRAGARVPLTTRPPLPRQGPQEQSLFPRVSRSDLQVRLLGTAAFATEYKIHLVFFPSSD